MYAQSWIAALAQALASSAETPASLRLAIVGVGNELDGDDAAGVLVVRRLKSQLPPRQNILFVDAGPAPENYSAPLRRFQPDWLIFIDAARMDELPGSIAWLDLDRVEGVSAATHGLPVKMLAGFLVQETGCQAGLLAIQAQDLGFDEPLTQGVAQAVDEVVRGLTQILSG